MPEVQGILYRTDVDLQQLHLPQSLFARLYDKWVSNAESQLVGTLFHDAPHCITDFNAQTLRLACIWFHCDVCIQPLAYPDILHHRAHPSEDATFNPHPSHDLDDVLNALEAEFEQKPRDFSAEGKIYLDLNAGNVSRELVLLCGSDPLATTATQMDELDARFQCQKCNMGMNWRRAVSVTSSTSATVTDQKL